MQLEIIGIDGQPLRKEKAQNVQHTGADKTSNVMAKYRPRLQSADKNILGEKHILDARTDDMARNFPMFAGAMRGERDATIGPLYRCAPKPKRKLLGWTSAFEESWSYGTAELWYCDAETSNWMDAKGYKTVTEILNQGWNSYFTRGEIFGTYEWNTDRPAPFGTMVNLIDVMRVDTPKDKMRDDTRENIIAGFAVDRWGHAYKAYIHDKCAVGTKRPNQRTNRNDYVARLRRSKTGREQWFHIFDDKLPEQTRGVSELTSAIKRAHMVNKLDDAALGAATLAAMYSAFLTSSAPNEAFEGLVRDEDYQSCSERYYQEFGEWLDSTGGLEVDNQSVAHLYPDSKFEFLTPKHPVEHFAEFESAMLRHLSSSLNIGYEEFTGDYKGSSFSSARAAIIHTWVSRNARRAQIINKMANSIYRNWLEEQVSNGRIPVPVGRTSRSRLNYFRNNKEAICNARWYGSPMQHIDPVKSAVSERILMHDIQSQTYEEHCATWYNEHYMDRFEQIAKEKKTRERLGIPVGGIDQEVEDNTTGRVNLASTDFSSLERSMVTDNYDS